MPGSGALRRSRRRVQIVDRAEVIERLATILEEMIDQGLIAISDVSTIRAKDRGRSKHLRGF